MTERAQTHLIFYSILMQLYIMYSTFLQKWKERTKRADICQIFQKASKTHKDLQLYRDEWLWWCQVE